MKCSCDKKNSEFNMRLNCLILPCITATLPSVTHNIAEFEIPSNVSLADPEFFMSNRIDLLIGADKLWNFCVMD